MRSKFAYEEYLRFVDIYLDLIPSDAEERQIKKLVNTWLKRHDGMQYFLNDLDAFILRFIKNLTEPEARVLQQQLLHD